MNQKLQQWIRALDLEAKRALGPVRRAAIMDARNALIRLHSLRYEHKQSHPLRLSA